MLNTNELRGMIAKKGLSQRRIARLIGVTEKTFYGKMRDGVFRTDELESIAGILGINRADYGTLFCDDAKPNKEAM